MSKATLEPPQRPMWRILGNPSFDTITRGEGDDSQHLIQTFNMAILHYYSPATRAEELLPIRLATLIWNWTRETAHLSSIPKAISHPSYQEIIGLGPAAIPLLLQRLSDEPDQPEFLFPALAAISGVNPVPSEHEGSLSEMAADWVKWGVDEDYLERA